MLLIRYASLMPNQFLLRVEISKYLWNSWIIEYVSSTSISNTTSSIQHTLQSNAILTFVCKADAVQWLLFYSHVLCNRSESTLGQLTGVRMGIDSRAAHKQLARILWPLVERGTKSQDPWDVFSRTGNWKCSLEVVFVFVKRRLCKIELLGLCAFLH